MTSLKSNVRFVAGNEVMKYNPITSCIIIQAPLLWTASISFTVLIWLFWTFLIPIGDFIQGNIQSSGAIDRTFERTLPFQVSAHYICFNYLHIILHLSEFFHFKFQYMFSSMIYTLSYNISHYSIESAMWDVHTPFPLLTTMCSIFRFPSWQWWILYWLLF